MSIRHPLGARRYSGTGSTTSTAISTGRSHWLTGAPGIVAGLSMLATGPLIAHEALLIGGGYDLQGSQGQIELNVKWVQGVLNDAGVPVSTWFTDGDQTGPDVHYQLPASEPDSALMPLSRVFGDEFLERRRYREHSVQNVIGSTRRETLEPQLRAVFEDRSDQDLLLIYNGHGQQSMSTPDRVTLELWDNSQVTASELHDWLRPHQAGLRFVFTQCYSGGFHRLAHADPARGLALAEPPRCGFTAESAYRLAEGCSASIDTQDYRDYTTFFFAALAGQDRNGQALTRDPDRDGDGSTTLREAHLYTLGEAWSTDLSRSTSEEWLDQWQPWYLRWLPTPADIPDNEYGAMLRDMADRHDVAIDDTFERIGIGGLSTELRRRLADVEQQWQQQDDELRRLDADIRERQYALQYRLLQLWPALMGPYTTAYMTLVETSVLSEIADQLTRLPDWQVLVQQQEAREALELTLLESEREATQWRKMIRLHRLSHLREQLHRHGSAQHQADYQSLLDCEQVPLAY